MAVREIRAVSGSQYLQTGRQTPLALGDEQHLLLGLVNKYQYSGAIKFDVSPGSGVWNNVLQITKIELVLKNADPAPHPQFAPTYKAAWQFRFLKSAYSDNSKTDGDDGSTAGWPTYTYMQNGMIPTNKMAVGDEITIDITAWAQRWAPKTVKWKDGTRHDPVTNYGIFLYPLVTAAQSNPKACFGSGDNDDDTLRPKLVITYVGVPVVGTCVLDGPTSPITQVEGEFFSGSFVPGTYDLRIAWVELELYAQGGTTPLWKRSAAASAQESATNTFSVPVSEARVPQSGTSPTTFGSLISGTNYEWRARTRNEKGEWTGWTDRRAIKVEASAPTFTVVSPSAGSYETLNNVRFGGTFPNSASARAHPLLSYRVQVRSSTLPSDPDWGSVVMFWDSGERIASRPERAPFTISSPDRDFGMTYRGQGLGPGTYSFRVRTKNTAGAESGWVYGSFTLTKGWEPDPGETERLTGYANRHAPIRILIKTIDQNPQQVTVQATGGSYVLSYDGHSTAAIAYNATDVTVKSRLEALPGIDTVTVVRTGASPKYVYLITFVAAWSLDKVVLLKVTSNSLTGDAHKVTVLGKTTRKPGRTVAVIEDAANIGVSEYYNSPGELYFTLPATHPQISVIEPYEVHYAVEVHTGEGWKEIASGLIHDFDGTSDDVVFYGIDYLGLLSMSYDERFKATSSDSPAELYPADPGMTGGSKYVNRTIKEIIKDQLDRAVNTPDSPLGFFTVNMPNDLQMDESLVIYCTFKERLSFISGLIESHKAGRGFRTRVRARKLIDNTYEFRVDDNPGIDRDNLRFAYGELVNGFRIIPYGDFGTRVNAIGQEIGGSKVDHVIEQTPAPADEDATYNEQRYGRFPKVNLWPDITDSNDLRRRAKQFAKRLGRVGKATALGIRVDALSIKDGWDICDSIPVDINRGVVNTANFAPDPTTGLSYWTIWGWVLKVSPDGHTDATLTILPREDDNPAAADGIIDASPILSNSGEWQLSPIDPVVGDASDYNRWTNTVTGEIFQFDPVLGIWVSLTATVDGAPAFLSEQGVTTTYLGDGSVAEIKIVDGAVTENKIGDGAVTAPKIGSDVNPVLNVPDKSAVDPPNSNGYPDGTIIWDVATQTMWKAVGNVWTRMEGVPGPPGTVAAYPGEPTLPDDDYPPDTIIYDTTSQTLKKNVDDVWVAVVNTTDLVGTIGAAQIAATTIKAHHLDVDDILTGNLIASAISAGLIRTASSGRRIELDTLSLRIIDEHGDLRLNAPTADGAPITIDADVWARTLTVPDAGSSTLGGPTTLPGSAVMSLANGIANPTSAPSVSSVLPTGLTLPDAPTGRGIAYVASGYSGVATYLVGGDPSLAGGYVFKEYRASDGVLLRTISPSNTSSVTTETVGATSHISDTWEARSGGSNDQIATPITIPTRSGVIKVTAVAAYFAGYGGTCAAKTMLWNSSGTFLGSSAEFTAASKTFSGGNSVLYNKALTSKVTVTSGQVVRAGFAHGNSGEGFWWDRDDGSGKTQYYGDAAYGSMSGGYATLTTEKPNVFITIEVTQTVTVEGTMGKIVGIARSTSHVWVLDSNGKLFQYLASDGSYVAQFNVSAYLLGYANAGLFNDGTNLVLVTTNGATGSDTVMLHKFNYSGAYTGTTINTTGFTFNGGTSYTRGGYNDGTYYWIVVNGVVRCFNKTTGAYVANREFGLSSEVADGITHDGTVFRGFVSGGAYVHKFSTWDWSDANTYWVGYSWADEGTAETACSPLANIALGRRRNLIVTNPTVPTTPVDKVRTYMLRSASSPAVTTLWRQTNDARTVTTRTLTSDTTSGSHALASSTFGSGTAAEIKDAGGTWSLKGDGSASFGAISAASISASGALFAGQGNPVHRIYSTPGTATWNKPANLHHIVVECVGGGGAGGGCGAASASQNSKGGGGGAGAYSRSVILAAALSSSYTVTVGNGGTGVSGTTGNSGGQSSFGSLVTAPGGSGGPTAGSSAAFFATRGGAGGTAGSGDFSVPGDPGKGGSGGANLGIGGEGGSGPWGGGAVGASTGSSAQSIVGSAATGYGGGGGGALSTSTGAANSGGAGYSGVVIVTEFYGP